MKAKRISRPISAVDKRKLNILVSRAVGIEILRGLDDERRRLDEDLMPTDRVLQRWAVSIGTGLPSDKWDDRPISRPSPLDDETAIVVDQIILRSPTRYKRLVKSWYKTPAPSAVIAEGMGVSRAGLYLEWRCALFYFRGGFRLSGHGELVRMLEDFSV